MSYDRNSLSATSIVLVGPEAWRNVVAQVVADNLSLDVVAGVECDPQEVDVDSISSADVILIAVDAERPNDVIEFSLGVQAKDPGTSIALVLPEMGEASLRKFHKYGGSWSMISAAACIDPVRIGAVIASAGRGIVWVDPIITRLLKTFIYEPEDLDIDIDVSAIDDFVRGISEAEEPDSEIDDLTLSLNQPRSRSTTDSPVGKILVVDDNDGIRLALTLLLEDEGHEVFKGRDGAEAVQLAQIASPDLILLDVMMPVMDGFEALTNLKALPATRHIPVIMVTAKGAADDLDRARNLGALDYISKPWLEGEVEASVAWALSRVTATT